VQAYAVHAMTSVSGGLANMRRHEDVMGVVAIMLNLREAIMDAR